MDAAGRKLLPEKMADRGPIIGWRPVDQQQVRAKRGQLPPQEITGFPHRSGGIGPAAVGADNFHWFASTEGKTGCSPKLKGQEDGELTTVEKSAHSQKKSIGQKKPQLCPDFEAGRQLPRCCMAVAGRPLGGRGLFCLKKPDRHGINGGKFIELMAACRRRSEFAEWAANAPIRCPNN